jgi:hypothetical protein
VTSACSLGRVVAGRLTREIDLQSSLSPFEPCEKERKWRNFQGALPSTEKLSSLWGGQVQESQARHSAQHDGLGHRRRLGTWWLVGPGADKASPESVGDHLCPIFQVKFGHDVAQVILDRVLADEEPLG